MSMISLILAVAGSIQAATPVETHGDLRVSGNRIVNASGVPTQLVGMSFYWSIWGGEKYYSRAVVDWLVKDWKVSLVRAAVAVEPTGGYLTQASTQTARAKTIVDAAIANGVYVIVDWHAHDANKNVAQAKQFFEEMARTYGNTPNILWEIWNEPDAAGGTGTNGADSWNDIKTYANEVIPVIRKYSKNLVVVGTPNWSQGVDQAAASPVSDANTAYTLHFYARTHGKSLRDRADVALSKNIAIVLTEWGTTHSDGGSAKNPGTDTVAAAAWLQWAAERKISWANWSLVNFTESSAALASQASTNGGWPVSDLSVSGAWVRRQILAASTATTSVVRAPTSSSNKPQLVGRRIDATGLTSPWSNVHLRALDGSVLLAVPRPAGVLSVPAGLRGAVILEWTSEGSLQSARFAIP
jgi:endoglucanase